MDSDFRVARGLLGRLNPDYAVGDHGAICICASAELQDLDRIELNVIRERNVDETASRDHARLRVGESVDRTLLVVDWRVNRQARVSGQDTRCGRERGTELSEVNQVKISSCRVLVVGLDDVTSRFFCRDLVGNPRNVKLVGRACGVRFVLNKVQNLNDFQLLAHHDSLGGSGRAILGIHRQDGSIGRHLKAFRQLYHNFRAFIHLVFDRELNLDQAAHLHSVDQRCQ